MVAAIIQARMGSTRFPGKVLKTLDGVPILEYLVKRLKKSKDLDEILIATTTKKEDQIIVSLGEKLGVKVYRGSENDVLSRFYYASLKLKSENIIRITGDCPFSDPEIVSQVISLFE